MTYQWFGMLTTCEHQFLHIDNHTEVKVSQLKVNQGVCEIDRYWNKADWAEQKTINSLLLIAVVDI